MTKKRPTVRTRGTKFTAFGKVVGGVVTVLGLLYYGIFILANLQMNPKIVIRFQGQRGGNKPIIPESIGIYKFALATNQTKDIILQNLEVYYNPKDSIELSPIDSADIFHLEFSDIKEYGFKLTYQRDFKMSQGIAQAFGFAYMLHDTSKTIKLLVRTRAQIAQWDWKFPLNLFSITSQQQDFPIELQYYDVSRLPNDQRIDRISMLVLPQEIMQTNGSMLKYSNELLMRATHGKIPVEIRSLQK
ncbi:MAG: hypothetical protein ABR936_16445 [Bacteroidota bacterium]|jgi:hypothetical protein